VSFASLMVGLRVADARRIETFEVVMASLVITFPVMWIVTAIYTWRDMRVGEQRGFAVRDDVEDPDV
jgi:hypothetical protein